jgi:hypothetical protein
MGDLKAEFPDIIIVAAAARDASQLVEEHIQTTKFDFVYLNGTPLYQDLKVPGLPSQLFVNRSGIIVDQHVGKDAEVIRAKAKQLMSN